MVSVHVYYVTTTYTFVCMQAVVAQVRLLDVLYKEAVNTYLQILL